MSQTNTLSIINSEIITLYPKFLVEKFLSNETEQKKVRKALGKTFLMNAHDERIVAIQAAELASTITPVELPFSGEFTSYGQSL